jgi:hypothetical protein
LGSDKKQLNPPELPDALKGSVEEIEREDTDAETKFLKTVTLSLSYYKAGIMPLKLNVQAEEALEETQDYCPLESLEILKETLSNKYNTLTGLWCRLCANKNLIVQPQLLPDLFEWGVATKKYSKDLFRLVIGNRGIWLSKFSDNWKFVNENEEIEDWETGTIQQRVKYLENLRNTVPLAAIDKIQSVWKEENAANRIDLIETLAINISKGDENFLLKILNDKSQKVKDVVLKLLKRIPDSEIIIKYQDVLSDSIKISQSKMLGLINKTNVDIKPNISNEDIFKTGIQNLSNNKNISDNDFIIMQLISETPPSFWEKQFNCNASEVIKLFASKDELKKFQSHLCNAVIKFNNTSWSKDILDQFDDIPVGMLYLLDEEERINYAGKFLHNNLDEVVNALRTSNTKEWSIKFSKQLLAKTCDNPSLYTKNFYEKICIYLPYSIINDLDNFTFSDEWKKSYWINLSQEITEYISLKEKIKNTF